MIAAYLLDRKETGAEFDNQKMRDEAKLVEQAADFKITARDPQARARANAGNVKDFTQDLIRVRKDFEVPTGEKLVETQKQMQRIYRKLTRGLKGEEKETFLSEQSFKYQEMVQATGSYIDRCKLQIKKPESNVLRPIDSMRVFSHAQDYQESKDHILELEGADLENVNLSMELARTVTVGTPAEKYYLAQVEHQKQVRAANIREVEGMSLGGPDAEQSMDAQILADAPAANQENLSAAPTPVEEGPVLKPSYDYPWQGR